MPPPLMVNRVKNHVLYEKLIFEDFWHFFGGVTNVPRRGPP